MLYYREQVEHEDAAQEMQSHVFRSLSPFYGFLNNAISSYKQREIIADWKRVPDIFVKLEPLHKVYLLKNACTVKPAFEAHWYLVKELSEDIEWEEPLKVMMDDGAKHEIKLKKEDLIERGGEKYVKIPLEGRIKKLVWGFEKPKVTAAWIEVDAVESIVQNGLEFKFCVQGSDLVVEGDVDPGKMVQVNGLSIPVIVNASSLDIDGFKYVEVKPKVVIKENEKRWRLFACEGTLPNGVIGEEIPDFWKNYPSEIGRFLLGEGKISLEEGKSLKFRVSKPDILASGKIIESELGFRFRVKAGGRAENRADEYWIQLIEAKGGDEEGFMAQSPLDYFFDEDVSVVLETKNSARGKFKLEIDRRYRNFEEKKIVLRNKDDQGRFFLPREGERLQVKVNTHNLRMQQQAIRALERQPLPAHNSLLKLLMPYKANLWPDFEPDSSIQEWFVLTQGDRKGTDEQRLFVEKAMATPDFAILEGPPGSGKTTAILELILQLTLQGKKILFCGSTHVAIDNVLERLQEKKLLARVLPIRIGPLGRIQDNVQEFQLEKQAKANPNISEALLLEASNLVCGTTIGILQHPFFKQRPEEEPAKARYDYLIIDECSKTTFQEYLVPAIFAKKWILVGDIKQLSPFTEREVIVSNLKELSFIEYNKSGKRKEVRLAPELQKACFIYQKLFPFHQRLILPLNIKIIAQLILEIKARDAEDGAELSDKIFGIITQKNATAHPDSNFRYWDTKSIKEKGAIELSACDVILVEDKAYAELSALFPVNFAVVGDANWGTSAHAFRFNCWDNFKDDYYYKDRGQSLKGGWEVTRHYNQYFKEKSWAEEIAWRLIRRYELRSKGDKKTARKYYKLIQKLKPRTMNIEEALFRIESFSLPSFLEGLQAGLPDRKRNDQKFASTLTLGLGESELACRHVKLTWQHRMHPDISGLPRELFYEGKALRDSPLVEQDREWAYSRYEKRREWLHITEQDHKLKGNRNEAEASALARELQHFLDFAQENPNPNHPEGIWEVAVLAFYRGQEKLLRSKLIQVLKYKESYAGGRFDCRQSLNIYVKLNTVDKFQGQEADLVFLSMVQNKRIGFLDSPNRLNVAITRARYQLLIIGNQDFFAGKTGKRDYDADDLIALAIKTQRMKGGTNESSI